MTALAPSPNLMSELLDRLTRIETVLQTILREKTVKEWYSTAEVAEMLSKSDYTVREWCRLGRVRASKKAQARGAHPEWLISHEELQRFRNEGLRPLATPS